MTRKRTNRLFMCWLRVSCHILSCAVITSIHSAVPLLHFFTDIVVHLRMSYLDKTWYTDNIFLIMVCYNFLATTLMQCSLYKIGIKESAASYNFISLFYLFLKQDANVVLVVNMLFIRI